ANLALELPVPAALVQLALEQEREADVVRVTLELHRAALRRRAMCGDLVQLVHGRRRNLVAERREQRPVHAQIRVAPDRRREVTVGGAREPRVTDVPRGVDGLLERAKHERWKRPAPAPGRLAVLE